MKTRIKEHTRTWIDTTKGKKTQRTYYTVQYKRVLFWHTVSRTAYFCKYPVEFLSRRSAENFREYLEQTGHTWVRM